MIRQLTNIEQVKVSKYVAVLYPEITKLREILTELSKPVDFGICGVSKDLEEHRFNLTKYLLAREYYKRLQNITCDRHHWERPYFQPHTPWIYAHTTIMEWYYGSIGLRNLAFEFSLSAFLFDLEYDSSNLRRITGKIIEIISDDNLEGEQP